MHRANRAVCSDGRLANRQSLIFDGGLLRKREGLGRTEVGALLLRMQENVKANVGVNIEIAVKTL